MIKFTPTAKDEAKLADNARTDRFEKAAAASKRTNDSDGRVRRDDETAKNNSLI